MHKQVAISLVTPAFPRALTTLTRHRVRLELVRPSDEACSEPLDFYFTAATAAPSLNSAVNRAADKENTGLLVNISDNPENNPNIKLELAPMISKDYQDLLCNNPMDLRDSGHIGENLTAFENVMNNLSGKIESLSFSFSDVIDDSVNRSDENNFDPLMPASGQRRASVKRSSVSAALETSSGQLKPKLSLHTPDHSDSLLSDHQIQMTRLLTNCPRINDL